MSLFFRKTVTTQNGLLIFLGKETHSETNHGNRQGFRRKSYNNNGKPWKSSRILRVNPMFFIFLSFFFFSLFFFIFSFFPFSFFHFFSIFFLFFQFFFLFFHFFHFFIFSFFSHFFFIYFIFSFSFFHFFFFLLFFFFCREAQKYFFFWGLNFVTISLHLSFEKNQIFDPSRVRERRVSHPLRPHFLFFSSLFFLLFSFSVIFLF